jgi:DNA phosphorothioation-associated DGQHR protein 1
MSTTVFPVRTPILKVVQPLGEFYVAILPADLLLKVTFSDPLQFLGVSESGQYELKGHQRKLVQNRLNAIGRFIDTVEAAFPNSIILAANYRETGDLEEDEGKRWAVEFSPESGTANGAAGKLLIPSEERLAAIVDGQHRLFGFKEASLKERLEMPLLCAVFLDLSHPFQAYLFATINYNQKPVDKSQSYELYGFNLEEEPPEAWSPEKTAVFMCRKLNTDPTSALKDHIIVAAQADAAIGMAAKSQKKGLGGLHCHDCHGASWPLFQQSEAGQRSDAQGGCWQRTREKDSRQRSCQGQDAPSSDVSGG